MAERLQKCEMLPNSGERAAQIVTLKTVAPGDGADDRPKPRIMGVRDVRKQMMLDLVVETAGEPGSEPQGGREIGRRADLVHSPIVTFPNASKLHSGREVRELKDDRQEPAEDKMKEEERGERPHPWQNEKGRCDKKQEV